MFQFSLEAEVDLWEIGLYTIDKWGAEQANRYLLTIDACCVRLAKNPCLGRACDQISLGLRRIEQGRHVIFYRRIADGIFVVRILHQDMQPDRHTLGDA